MPSPATWRALADCPPDQRITLISFFRIRERSAYPPDYVGDDPDVSGQTALDRYAAVSMPSLEQVGVHFLLVAPFGGTFVGEPETWDLVAIGTYPNSSALLTLFELEAYREAYVHRVAACADQLVSLCLG